MSRASAKLGARSRLLQLSLWAAILAAGPVPWLVSVSFCLIAAAQEPLFLRSFGIFLVAQSATFCGALTLLVVSAHLHIVRRPSSHLMAVALLTVALSLFVAAVIVLVESARGGPFASALDPKLVPRFFLICYPAALCAANLGFRATFANASHLVFQSILVIDLLPAIGAGDWSLPLGVATIARTLSALAATIYCCRQKK